MAGSPDDGGGAGAGRVLVAGRAAAALRRTPGLGGSRVPSAKRFEGLVDDVAPTDPLVAGVGHQEVSKVGRAALVVLQQKAKATDDITSFVVVSLATLATSTTRPICQFLMIHRTSLERLSSAVSRKDNRVARFKLS